MKKIKCYIIVGLIVFAGMISLSYVQNVDAYQPSQTYSVSQGTGLSAETADSVTKCNQGHTDCDGNHTCSLGHENCDNDHENQCSLEHESCNSDHQNHKKENHHFNNDRHHH